ncbi:MAG TPA: VWA domain-containing protein [Longimicrobium sp.]
MGLLARLRGARRAPEPDAPPPVALEDVRRRLELLLAALYDRPITVAAAEAPRAPGRLRRLFLRTPAHLQPTEPLPASDGERVFLPPRLPSGEGDAVARYRLMAVEQAERLARGTAAALSGDEPPLVRDLYLLAEGAAVEDAIARTAPGLAPAQAAERAAALARRPEMDVLTPAEREVEQLVRGVLAGEAADLPAAAEPADSLAWARATAARLASAGARYRGVPPVAAWGTVVAAPSASSSARRPRLNQDIHRSRTTRTRSARFAPPLRYAASPGDDRSETSINAADAASPTNIADPRGGSVTSGGGDADAEREPPDMTGTSSPEAAGRTAAPASPLEIPPPAAIPYPEWDADAGGYRRPGAFVRVAGTVPGDGEWSAQVLRTHAATVRRLREQFERLRARRLRLTAQRDGDELDLAACVRALVDLRTGHTVSDRLYAAVRPARRELSILLLVDISGSTSEWVNGIPIIDIEKRALLLASEAFDALGDRYAVLTFSGKGAANVRMRVVKGFGERNGDEVRARVAGLRPEGYTRMGAAIRHAADVLARQGARHRLLLILSDGKPNDDDHYQGSFAVEDTRQAVAEARALGVFPFCLTVDQKAAAYLPRIFGPAGHVILHHPEHLPLALLKVVRGLLRG